MFIENVIFNQTAKVKVYLLNYKLSSKLLIEIFLMKTKKNDIITCFYPKTIELRAGKYNLFWKNK